MLTLVPTPIGNLKDITLRALECLENVDAIICEDTRRTSILLSHYKIKKPLYPLNDFNEARDLTKYLNMLIEGKNLALVSDAGTPLIADPGYKLVQACFDSNIEVDSLPGANAAITALTLSGLPVNRILFLGYPSDKPGKRLKFFEENIKNEHKLGATLIFYISPHKLIKALADLNTLIPQVSIVLATELTKLHQKIMGKTPSEWINYFEKSPPKGEYVMLFNVKQK